MGTDYFQHRRTSGTFNLHVKGASPKNITRVANNVTEAVTDIRNQTQALIPQTNTPSHVPPPTFKMDTWGQTLLTGLYASQINFKPILPDYSVTDRVLAEKLLLPYSAVPLVRKERATIPETYEILNARANAVHNCGNKYQIWVNEMSLPIPKTSDETTHCSNVFNTIRIVRQDQNLQLTNIDSTMCMASCPATIRILLDDIAACRAKLAEFDTMIIQLNDSPITYDDSTIRQNILNEKTALNTAIDQLQALLDRCVMMASQAAVIQNKFSQVSNDIVFHCGHLLGDDYRLRDFDINATDPSYYLLLDSINKAKDLKGKIDVLETQIRNQLRIVARRPTHS